MNYVDMMRHKDKAKALKIIAEQMKSAGGFEFCAKALDDAADSIDALLMELDKVRKAVENDR